MIVCGIDPGPQESAVVAWDGIRILAMANKRNDFVVGFTEGIAEGILAHDGPGFQCHVGIEQIRGFGIQAGNELFDTVWWTGRLFQALTPYPGKGLLIPKMIPRKEVVRELTGHTKNGDKEVREALIYRFGQPGTKKAPGVLYQVSGHLWPALAVAVVLWDRLNDKGRESVDALPSPVILSDSR